MTLFADKFGRAITAKNIPKRRFQNNGSGDVMRSTQINVTKKISSIKKT